jgi:DNA-directed RNA polymerase subunit RPC12/RpoP
MTPHFINLNCTNCGAKLDVHDDDDMERFACGYCGTEIIVQRRGGTVALKALTAAIIKVQTGTDKTAAELALARYEKEIAALGISRADLRRSTPIVDPAAAVSK